MRERLVGGGGGVHDTKKLMGKKEVLLLYNTAKIWSSVRKRGKCSFGGMLIMLTQNPKNSTHFKPLKT